MRVITVDPLKRLPRLSVAAPSGATLVAVAGAVLVVVGLLSTLATFNDTFQDFDEGLLVTGADHLLDGRIPFRDWYSAYPPGIYLLIAVVWKVLGTSITTYRLLGIALHLTIGLLAGRLAGRVIGRRFSWIACGLTLLWLAVLSSPPFAWVAALCVSLVAVELALSAHACGGRGRWLGAGLAFGTVSTLRLDLFAFLAVALLLVGVVGLVTRRRRLNRSALRTAGWVAVGLAIPMLVVWGPTLVLAGVRHPVADLFLDQTKFVEPTAALPMPDLLAGQEVANNAFSLPALIASPLQAGIVLTLLAPILAGLIVLAGRRRRWPHDTGAAALLGVLALAVIPQMVHRPDFVHAVYTVTPALVLCTGLLEVRARSASPSGLLLAACGVALLVLPIHQTVFHASSVRKLAVGSFGERAGGLDGDQAPAERRLAAFIDAHTRPDEEIFVATAQNRLPVVNSPTVYYLANRRSAVRYFTFEVGLVTRAGFQRRIVRTLERKGTRLVVRYGNMTLFPLAPGKLRPGSILLDGYLAAHFRRVAAFGSWVVELRR